ncbi:DUF4230 domain-containing protein [Arthrobacter sp. SLBN-83]|uniref:DUF4230 domain-containing protein n=1 Tax=Arthrobacter sp. SLBN-83 TaxID=2768449 RepID=UPI00114F25CF|nr:DUF4230 domain-containing protein [Arthrobacter sp. SLBN-83]
MLQPELLRRPSTRTMLTVPWQTSWRPPDTIRRGWRPRRYVDMSSPWEDDFTVSSDGILVELTLPAAELGKPNLDFDRSHVYSDDRGVVDRLVDVFEPPQQAEHY